MLPEIVPLWQHQKDGVERALTLRDFALFYEQGTGKTRTTISILRNLFAKYGKPLKTLILCPAIVCENWRKEIEKYSKMGKYVQVLTGKKQDRIDALANEDRKIFITNYEALDMENLFWESVRKTRVPLNRGFEVIVCDESHRCKNPSALRTKILIRIADKACHRYILTGTPILQGPMDVFSQFRILDRGETFGDNFFVFRANYFYDKNAGKPSHVTWPDWQPRPGIEAIFNSMIYRKATRVLKKDCIDLPPLVTQRLEIELSGEQRKHYERLRKDYITFIGSDSCSADLAITKALRLQQILSGYIQPDGTENAVVFKKTPREEALRDLLADYARGNKIIIWACFRQNYKTIAAVCKDLELSHTFLHGEVSQKKKNKAVEDFCFGDKQVLIANPGAGGTGVNLIQASVAIYYSRSFNLEHRLQSQARNYRGGSTMHDKVTQIDLVAKDTMDELVLEALDRKENVAEMILKLGVKI